MDPFALLVTFQAQPWLALLPAILFAALWMISRHRLVLATSVLWLLYTGYEAAMKARILCSGECNIRIDLLIIGPVLIGLSTLALVAFAWWAIRRQAPTGGP